MDYTIGQLIKRIAESQGLSQKEFGLKINRTKQGVASIYRRVTIDTELLITICKELDYDFFSRYYLEEPLRSFRQKEIDNWQSKIEDLTKLLDSNEKLLKSSEEVITLQRKYILKLEED